MAATNVVLSESRKEKRRRKLEPRISTDEARIKRKRAESGKGGRDGSRRTTTENTEDTEKEGRNS